MPILIKLPHGNQKDCLMRVLKIHRHLIILLLFYPEIKYLNKARKQVKLEGSCPKQDKLTFTPKEVLHFCNVNDIKLWLLNLDNTFDLFNSLFGAVKLTTNADSDKFSYSGYGNGFDTRGFIWLSYGIEFDENITIFGADNLCSMYADNRKNMFQI